MGKNIKGTLFNPEGIGYIFFLFFEGGNKDEFDIINPNPNKKQDPDP